VFHPYTVRAVVVDEEERQKCYICQLERLMKLQHRCGVKHLDGCGSVFPSGTSVIQKLEIGLISSKISTLTVNNI